jgi:hypothetical protein
VTTQQTLDEARRAATEAAERAAAAERELERQVAEAQERRQRALQEWDKRYEEEFDYASLTKEIQQTRAEYQAAVLADPVNQAAIRYIGAMRKRAALAEEAHNARKRLGLVPQDSPLPSEHVALAPQYMAENINNLLEQAVHNDWADLIDRLEAERAEYGERAARGELDGE